MTPLHQFGQLVRDVLATVPLPFVRALFIALLLAVFVWTLCLPKETTVPDGPSPSRPTENLKLWAGLALLVQVAIYCLI